MGDIVQEKLAELLAEPLTERHLFCKQTLASHFLQPQHVGTTLSHRGLTQSCH